MSRDELKPCPFCGERQGMHKEQGSYLLNSTSHKRSCIMRKLLSFSDAPSVCFDTPADTVNAWNTRMMYDGLFEEGESVFDMNPVDGVCCPHCHESFRVEGIPTFETGIVEVGGVVEECVPSYCPYCGEEMDLGY